MIERRLAVPWPSWRIAARISPLRGQGSIGSLARIGRMRVQQPAAAVPWGFRDAAAVAGWTLLLATGAAVGLIVVRLLVALVFLVGEMTWLLPEGAYDRLVLSVGPYSTALTALVVGGGLYASLIYGVYRCSILRYGTPWTSLGFTRLPAPVLGRLVLLFIPVTIGGVILNWVLRTVFHLGQSGSQLALLDAGMTATSANFAMLTLVLVGIAPVAEELFFRGFLFRLLRQRWPAWSTISVTAVAFAALHGSPAMFPWLFFMGLVFGIAVETTGSIYAGIVLHAMINSLAMLGVVAALSGW